MDNIMDVLLNTRKIWKVNLERGVSKKTVTWKKFMIKLAPENIRFEIFSIKSI